MTLQTINSLRSESEFELLWQKTVQQAKVLEITQPSLPRKRKRPAKLLNENEASHDDDIHDDISDEFSQPGYRAVKNIEQLILNAINGLEYQNRLVDVLSDYGEEINHYRL